MKCTAWQDPILVNNKINKCPPDVHLMDFIIIIHPVFVVNKSDVIVSRNLSHVGYSCGF